MASSEPGIVASVIGGGVSVVGLGTAGYDALIENGWQPKSAMFVVLVATALVSLLSAWWARRSTVTQDDYNAATAVARALPSNTSAEDLNKALATQPQPLPPVTPAPVVDPLDETRPRTVTR